MVALTATLYMLPVLASLLGWSNAATLYTESRTMRRETRAVHLSSRGEIKRAKSEISDIEATDFCNDDFPLGKEASNNCTSANQSLILEENMCLEAARQSGATTPHGSFKVSYSWEGKYPKGCFKHTCAEAGNKICYFYNGNGVFPSGTLSGNPVCSRPKHLNGTKNTNGGCPTGYQVVDDEAFCSAAADCLGYCSGAAFRIGEHNASQHLDHPRGCFIDNTDGCVYYNAASPMGAGTTVHGTPICNVTEVVQWPAPAPGPPTAGGNASSS